MHIYPHSDYDYSIEDRIAICNSSNQTMVEITFFFLQSIYNIYIWRQLGVLAWYTGKIQGLL